MTAWGAGGSAILSSLTGAILLGVACSYGYTISEKLDGPAAELDAQVPAIQIRARVCVEGAPVDAVGIELRARATLDSPVGSEVRVALSRDPFGDDWDVSYKDVAVGEDGAELSLEGGASTEEACETGQSFWIERVDAQLEGTVRVDWSVVARAYSGDQDLEDHGTITIHLD